MEESAHQTSDIAGSRERVDGLRGHPFDWQTGHRGCGWTKGLWELLEKNDQTYPERQHSPETLTSSLPYSHLLGGDFGFRNALWGQT